MPPRVVHAAQAGNGVSAFWNSLPPISRTLTLLMVVVTVAGNYGFLPLGSLALLWKPITKKFEVGWPRVGWPHAQVGAMCAWSARAHAMHAYMHGCTCCLSSCMGGVPTYGPFLHACLRTHCPLHAQASVPARKQAPAP